MLKAEHAEEFNMNECVCVYKLKRWHLPFKLKCDSKQANWKISTEIKRLCHTAVVEKSFTINNKTTSIHGIFFFFYLHTMHIFTTNVERKTAIFSYFSLMLLLSKSWQKSSLLRYLKISLTRLHLNSTHKKRRKEDLKENQQFLSPQRTLILNQCDIETFRLSHDIQDFHRNQDEEMKSEKIALSLSKSLNDFIATFSFSFLMTIYMTV